MDDLTVDDFRLLLSLLRFAIVAPEQRERVQSALEDGRESAEKALRSYESIRRRFLDETGHERN